MEIGKTAAGRIVDALRDARSHDELGEADVREEVRRLLAAVESAAQGDDEASALEWEGPPPAVLEQLDGAKGLSPALWSRALRRPGGGRDAVGRGKRAMREAPPGAAATAPPPSGKRARKGKDRAGVASGGALDAFEEYRESKSRSYRNRGRRSLRPP